MRGVNSQKVIHEIQVLAEKLQEYSHRLTGNFEQKDLLVNLRLDISNYKNESNQDSRSKIADKMYSTLNSIIESLSTSIDKTV
ncbi:hypothetical protein MS2017_0643 [Bathymodiolus thermophilus thioautotrophic gill symbiont]|uniref:Uncharacterized protein n=1 Tax=Bathymodiolus thermophilus thioautotrophic gill symbiont TaxID=2360 RepID=A0A3G3IKK9_9GAMM|nr:hypothetical protein MS2017_0643 [Bathymodiolus thermophilus thioautotrophic gill symbiont]